MRPSLRFLCLTILGWAGLRAATLGAIPGAEIFRVERSDAKAAGVRPTEFPPIDPLIPPVEGPSPPPLDGTGRYPGPIPIPVYYPVSRPVARGDDRTALAGVMPEPRQMLYGPPPAPDEWPLSRLAASSFAPLQSSVVAPLQSVPAVVRPHGVDRLQLSTWAMLRSQQAGVAGTPSLSSGGSLGASQAGARLIYNFTRQLAAVVRTSSEVGRRGGEVAAGVRVQPLSGLPIWLTAERRQRVGRFGGGRNAFAVFLEGGVYDRPMPLRFLLDAYLQGGVVSVHRRDKFVDGGLTLTRPVTKQFSAGVGVWGGAQPGVYRVDAGPRVTMRVRRNVKVHLDWRQRLAGKALPGSGPAITLAGDF